MILNLPESYFYKVFNSLLKKFASFSWNIIFHDFSDVFLKKYLSYIIVPFYQDDFYLQKKNFKRLSFSWRTEIYDIIINLKYKLMADEPTSEFVSGYLFPLLLFLRNTVVGTVSFGLLIGAILFIRYLHRLSNLPKASREYRELSYHM